MGEGKIGVCSVLFVCGMDHGLVRDVWIVGMETSLYSPETQSGN